MRVDSPRSRLRTKHVDLNRHTSSRDRRRRRFHVRLRYARSSGDVFKGIYLVGMGHSAGRLCRLFRLLETIHTQPSHLAELL